MSMLRVENLIVRFGERTVVNGLTFDLARGERVGIIGESGSGKTMTALAILDLLPVGAGVLGSLSLDGAVLPLGDDRAMSRLRGSQIAMVFQEPLTALNPLMPIWKQLALPLRRHHRCSRAEARERAESWCAKVGLPQHAISAYPHQLSGGQRQRVGIAIALCGQPGLVIADEPTSALDVTVQSEILDLLLGLTTESKTSLIFISHDLAVVNQMTSRVLVMHQGTLVEQGDTAKVFTAPQDPYTDRLVASAKRSAMALRELTGEPR
jgi:ABC-type microcin C transport system duplicated ATPase subunit YejF